MDFHMLSLRLLLISSNVMIREQFPGYDFGRRFRLPGIGGSQYGRANSATGWAWAAYSCTESSEMASQTWRLDRTSRLCRGPGDGCWHYPYHDYLAWLPWRPLFTEHHLLS